MLESSRVFRRALGSLACASAIFVGEGVARAEDEIDPRSLEAEGLAGRAHEAWERGAFREALESYTAAYEVQPAAVLLFDIAVLYDEHLGAPALARDYYQRASVAIDAEPSLAARARERMARIDASRASLQAARPAPEKPKETRGWHSLTVGGAVSLGAGALALGATTVLAIVAKNKDRDADAFCNGDRCTDQRGVDLANEASSLTTAGNVTFVVGTTLVATGVVLLLVAPSRSSRTASIPPFTGYAW